jgi:hypothetical protein
MSRQKVISREYKLALKAKKFTGDEAELIEKATVFWTELQKAIKTIAATTERTIDIKSRREINFYDTQARTLQKAHYIFRERKDLADDQKEITLKFRHPDRYVAQDRDMSVQDSVESEIKFEEDIKAPFAVLYSFSSTRAIEHETQLAKLKHIAKIYGGLAAQFDQSRLEEKIDVVNGHVVHEMVITGPQIILNGDTLEKAECALIVWHDAETIGARPLTAEFSFRYKNKQEEYSAATSQKAHDVFLLVQEKLERWIDKKNTTKTGLVFNL